MNNSNSINILSEQYNDTLTQYQSTYKEYISSLTQSNPESDYSRYSSKLQLLNQKLIDLNQQITNILNQTYSSYESDKQKQQEQSQMLQQNYGTLMDERIQIEKLIKEYETLNEASNNTQTAVTEYYSRYIVLLFITILLVILLVKYAVTGQEQQGGMKPFFMKEAMFLFILMTVLLGLAHIFKNIDAYILLTLLIITYVVIKIQKR